MNFIRRDDRVVRILHMNIYIMFIHLLQRVCSALIAEKKLASMQCVGL